MRRLRRNFTRPAEHAENRDLKSRTARCAELVLSFIGAMGDLPD
jgi:hypothetical protein